MADNPQSPAKGGNTPKPKPSGSGSGQSAKDQSRAASRPVATKSPGKGGKGGNTPRPGGKQAVPVKAPTSSRSTALLVWGAVGIVVVIIAALVLVKVFGSSSKDLSYTPVTPAPASVVHDVTNIPLSVYNTVGVNSSVVAVTPPTITKGRSPLTLGGSSPAMLYIGAEYCPYCAAERWAMTAALSRFGTWSDLKITASSHTDVDASTNTFSYHGASMTSPYITFQSVEHQSNQPTSTGNYSILEPLTPKEQSIYNTAAQYVKNIQAGTIGYPFVNINNLAYIFGPSFDPQVLAGQSWSTIAGNLSDPTNPATQAIVTTANYISAVICSSSKGQPGSVCQSSGVQAAAKALGISAS